MEKFKSSFFMCKNIIFDFQIKGVMRTNTGPKITIIFE